MPSKNGIPEIGDSRYEHLDLDRETGLIKGLWKVNESQARGDFWAKVDAVIQAYTKLHPQEMVECLEHCRRKRESAFNDYGLNVEDANSSLRMGIALPNGLLVKIMALDMEFLEPQGKRLHKFQKLYPGFNTTKKF